MAAAVVAPPIICATSGACTALAAGASAALSIYLGAQLGADPSRVAARAAEFAAEAAHSAAVAAGEATAPLRAAAAAAAIAAAGQGVSAMQSAATRAAVASDGTDLTSATRKAALLAVSAVERLRGFYASATEAAGGLRTSSKRAEPTAAARSEGETYVRTVRGDAIEPDHVFVFRPPTHFSHMSQPTFSQISPLILVFRLHSLRARSRRMRVGRVLTTTSCRRCGTRWRACRRAPRSASST